jgi:hypothetical protein
VPLLSVTQTKPSVNESPSLVERLEEKESKTETQNLGVTNNDCTAVIDAVPPGTNSHSVGLSGLSTSTFYYFRARSKDALGNESLSYVSNFTTPATAGSALPATGQLTSATFDSATSPAYNSILWKGTAGTGKVQFQFATSNSSSGPWTYYGSPDGGVTCNSSSWYNTTGPDSPVEISCNPQQHNNQRFYRYKIQLCSNSDCSTSGTTSPVVTNVVVNWSP